jgi:CubicO group peptidase (beta-lactamase class C family)
LQVVLDQQQMHGRHCHGERLKESQSVAAEECARLDIPIDRRSMMNDTTACPSRRRALLAALLAAATLGACGGDGRDGGPAAAPQAAAASGVAAGLAGAAAGTVTSSRADVGAAGMAVVATKTPVTADALFMLGSNTKAMTAAVAARLVEEGVVRWDTRIGDALPELQSTMLPAYAGVTLEQLLDHRGGLRAYTGAEDLDAFMAFVQSSPGPLPVDEAGRRLFVAAHVLQQSPPDGVIPGTTYLYSNAGYEVAAAMLERVTGRRYEDLFDAELARPLGIAGRWGRPELAGATQPRSYWGQPGRLTLTAPEDPDVQPWLDTLAPAGMFATTARGYATWLQWHLRALKGEATPLPAGYVQRLQAAPPGQYVLGWLVGQFDGHAVLAHAGAIDGFLAEAVVARDGGDAAFMMTNTSDIEGGASAGSWAMSTLDTTLFELYGAALRER